MHKFISTSALVVVIASGFAFAQTERMTVRGDDFQSAGAIHLEFSGPEDRKPVKGLPLAADIVNTHVQYLQDGNKITNTETSHFYRDNEGRTRRENNLVLPGQTGGNAPSMIMINDPVAHARFILNTETRSVDKLPSGLPPGANVVYVKKQIDEQRVRGSASENEQKEDLGTQTIEGLVARGTRSSHVIPAGKIGNEKPITVTTESWYSDEIGMEVLRVHNDPWSGEITTKVTNVRRGEQDASLFVPPADYEVNTEKGTRVIRIQTKDDEQLPPPPPPQD